MCEYFETATTPTFSKSYVYAGSRLLSTGTNVSGSEVVEFHHPDRLGTKLVTNPSASTEYEQATLPFGTALAAESTGFSNQTFTSYDRSAGTGLDYAVNRTHSPGQGRFTHVDPLGMGATSIGDPQSNNLFAYTQNMPQDFVDPSGLLLAIDYGSCHVTGYIIYGRWDGETFYPNREYAEIQTCNLIEIGPSGGPPETGGTGGVAGGVPRVVIMNDERDNQQRGTEACARAKIRRAHQETLGDTIKIQVAASAFGLGVLAAMIGGVPGKVPGGLSFPYSGGELKNQVQKALSTKILAALEDCRKQFPLGVLDAATIARLALTTGI